MSLLPATRKEMEVAQLSYLLVLLLFALLAVGPWLLLLDNTRKQLDRGQLDDIQPPQPWPRTPPAKPP